MGFLTRGTDHETTVLNSLKAEKPGRVLDAGCGWGRIAKALLAEGFEVSACDLDTDRISPCPEGIDFQVVDLNQGLPYPDAFFDYVCCTEVIEHVEDPFALIAGLRRILKPNGLLYITTPNILNMQSRLRYLFEGAYAFFKYPVVEWMEDGTQDLHINPIRLHELEYYFYKNRMQIEAIASSWILYKWRLLLFPIEWLSRMQMRIKDLRSSRPGEIDTRRLYRIMNTPELLYGVQLVVKARKVMTVPEKYRV